MTWRGPPPRPNVVPFEGSQQARIEEAIGALEQVGDDAALLWTGGKEANVLADLLLYAVGDVNEQSPIPFIVIDTGNQFPEMYDFREEYTAMTGDEGANTVGPPTGIETVHTLRYDDLLDGVILNDDDPRGYHGEWDATVSLPDEDPVDGLPRSSEEWGVPESCGALKVVPIRRAIEDLGVSTLVTGRRGEDPLTPGDDADLAVRVERSTPAPHTRVNPLASWSEANVYAYLKHESVSLSSLYTEERMRHTDAECCTDTETQAGEYGEGGRDPQKRAARDRLEEMGYV